VGVGSDTTDPVMNGLAEAITLNGSKPLGSYDALGGTFTSRTANPSGNSAGCEYLDNTTTQPTDAILRPNGSSAGRNALIASLTSGNARFGCLDFARSSSLNLAAAPVSLTYVPFALDGLTYGMRGDSVIPRDLTQATLRSIYNCETDAYLPLIPQRGSGTRGSWLSYVGLTEGAIPSCVKDTYVDPADGQAKPVQEHDGRGLVDKRNIVPFSASQWSAQSVGAIQDRRFGVVLGGIAGIPAIAVNTAGASTRTVYNILPTSRIGSTSTPGDTLLNQVFVGPTSEVCKQGAVIGRFGFAQVPNCGTTNAVTATPAS
jgi:hypothetical protein